MTQAKSQPKKLTAQQEGDIGIYIAFYHGTKLVAQAREEMAQRHGLSIWKVKQLARKYEQEAKR